MLKRTFERSPEILDLMINKMLQRIQSEMGN